MKRFLSFILISAFIFACTGCSDTPDTAVSSEQATEAIAQEDLFEAEATEEPAPDFCTFTVDPYILPTDLSTYLEGADADWAALIGAALAGEAGGGASVVVTDAACAQRVAEVFTRTPYSAFVMVDVSENTMELSYSNIGNSTAFHDAVQELVETSVYTESNQLETAVGLYRALASSCTFEESDNNSLYRMIVEKKGGTLEFALALQYLFAQNGISAQIASGTAGDVEHYWVIAELKGQLYHFDPTFENTSTDGLGLTYFAMSDNAHAAAGCSAQYSVGFGELAETCEALCPDDTFDNILTEVTDWNMDVRNHFLYLAYNFEPDFLTSISTETAAAAAG